MVYKSPKLADTREAAAGLSAILEVEMNLHVKLCAGWGLSASELDLKRKVDEVNPTINTPPLDARSPDTRIGVINVPGAQQQYGKNFGNSAIRSRMKAGSLCRW